MLLINVCGETHGQLCVRIILLPRAIGKEFS